MSSKRRQTIFMTGQTRGTSYADNLRSEQSLFTEKKGFSKDSVLLSNELSAAVNKLNLYNVSGKFPKIIKHLEEKIAKMIAQLEKLGNTVTPIGKGKTHLYHVSSLSTDDVTQEENPDHKAAGASL
jgi:hypothetical protein